MFTETLRNRIVLRHLKTSAYRKANLIWLVFAAVLFLVVIILVWSLWNDFDDYEDCTSCFFDDNYASCENLGLLYVPPCLPPNLLELRIYGNFLRKLVWARRSQFPTLQYLDLGLNALADVPEDSFLHMPDLTHLLLDANTLVSLPDGLFRNNTRMVYLSIEQNSLRWLNVDMFEPLTRLQYLKLSGNKIASLEGARGFTNNRQLVYLDLSSNLLRSLGNLYLAPETETSVYLEDNPLICDVDALRFVVSAIDLGISIDDHPICSDPPHTRGVPLLKINCSLSSQDTKSHDHKV